MFAVIFIGLALCGSIALVAFILTSWIARRRVLREFDVEPPLGAPVPVVAPPPAEAPDPFRRFESIRSVARLLMPREGTVCVVKAVDGVTAIVLSRDYEHACGFRLVETTLISMTRVTHRIEFRSGAASERAHREEIAHRIEDVDVRSLLEEAEAVRGLHGAVGLIRPDAEWTWTTLPSAEKRYCA